MSGSMPVRWTVRVLGVVLMVALAVLLVLRVYGSHRLAAAEREFAAKLGPVEGSQYASAKVPDEENAAIFLRAGAEAMILMPKERARASEMTMSPGTAWTAEQREFVRGFLASNRPALELLRRAAGMRKAGFGLVDRATMTEDLKTKLPLLKLLWGQRLLLLDARLAMIDGDQVSFVSDVGSMSVMATSMYQESPLISELVAIAAEKALLEVISEAVAKPAIDAPTLSRVERTIVDFDPHSALKRSLASEFLALREPGELKQAEKLALEQSAWKTALYRLAPSCFDAPYLEMMARLVAAVGVPYGAGLEKQVAQHSGRSISPRALAVPNLVNAVGRNQVVLSERRLARLALRLRRHALEAGAYPTSLASFPEALGRDPFTGGQLVYTLRPDGSAQLAVPDGVRLWDRLNPEVHNPGPFTWELPAPRQATASAPKMSGGRARSRR